MKDLKTDATSRSIVNVAMICTSKPFGIIHITVESEDHSELSHEVPPILAVGVKSSHPRFPPIIVLITPPKDGPFGCTSEVARGTSYVKRRVVVDTLRPTVIASGFGKSKPRGTLQTAAVEDVQTVASHPVPPPMCVAWCCAVVPKPATLAAGVKSTPPNMDPKTEILELPLTREFEGRADEILGLL